MDDEEIGRAGRRRFPLAMILLVLVALGVLAAACAKSNDLVAREQFKASAQACAKGCEQHVPGCDIKGNISTTGAKYYHMPGTTNYNAIIIQPEKGERWFCTEQEAQDNGWRRKDS